MAETSEKTTGAGNKVPHQGDHDRVQMLSLRADGVPDQHNPELIGEKEAALAATKRQFAEQAVSAVDVAERATSAVDGGEQLEQDPSIAALQEKHDAAASAAEKTAESVVNKLHQGD